LLARAAVEKNRRKLRALNDEIERLMDEQEKRKSSQGKLVRKIDFPLCPVHRGNANRQFAKRPRIHLNKVKASVVTRCVKCSYDISPAEIRRII
jgi:hypothetical protein